MRQWFQRPTGRIIIGISVIALIAIVGGALYLFGTGGTSASNGPVTAPTLVATNGGKIFTIDSSSSTASFTIKEVLFGNPNTVVGTTHQVAGQILVNAQTPAKSQVGEIRVDVSALVTDNPLRNRTLQNRILETGTPANQYATFVPTALTGLPTSIAVGQTMSFQIQGQLTIHQVTRPATFAAQVTLRSTTELTGQATTTVNYQDFNITIPNVPSVTGVGDTVQLAINFTANA